MQYPVFLGYKLNEREKLLTQFILGSLPEGTVTYCSSFSNSDLTGNPYYPDLTIREIRELVQWRRPILVFLGCAAKKNSKENYEILFESGIGSIWKIPEDDEPFLLPSLEIPRKKGQIYLISDDKPEVNVLRQIFQFGGYQTRIDFRSSEELVLELHETASKGTDWPALIAVDLDTKKIDVTSFFYKLKSLLKDHPESTKKKAVLIMKDFARPGLELKVMSSVLKPFAKKIFHPHEAILSVIEGMIAFSPDAKDSNLVHLNRPRSLAEILYGRGEKPSWNSRTENQLKALFPGEYAHREILFTWIYEYLTSDTVRSGALLSPEPDINSGDFFNGIRRP